MATGGRGRGGPRRAGDALADAGAIVEEVELAWTKEIIDVWYDYWGVLLAAAFAEHLDAFREKMDPNVVGLIEAGLAMDAVAFKRIEAVRTAQWLELARVFRDHDALLCPTMALPAPPVGGSEDAFDHMDAQGRYHGLDMTSPFNNVGQCPALSVPSGFTAAGLPTALQIVGRRFDDVGVLCIGAALEVVRPWSGHRPGI